MRTDKTKYELTVENVQLHITVNKLKEENKRLKERKSFWKNVCIVLNKIINRIE